MLAPERHSRRDLLAAAAIVVVVAVAVAVVWIALALAYFTIYPVGFYVTTLAFAVYVVTRIATR